MNSLLIDKYVIELMEKSGWYTGRKFDTSLWINELSKEGYSCFDYAIEILQELGGIEVNVGNSNGDSDNSESFGDWLSDTFSSVKDKVSDAVDEASNSVSDLEGEIEDAGNDISSWAQETESNAEETISNAEDKVEDMFGEITDNLENTYDKVVGDVEDSAKDFTIGANDGDTIADIKQISDGLECELYTEDGWIKRFSKERYDEI